VDFPLNDSRALGRILGARLSFLLGLCVLSASADPFISEFVADNETGLRDQDGEYSDWLEIYNPDPDPVDLSGYYLTDTITNPIKWEIPATTVLGPGEFLVIFASGKDRAIAGQQLHANFRLDKTGEYLALLAPDGSTVVSEYAPVFPVQFPDSSYGIEQIPNTLEEALVDVDSACTALVPTDGSLGDTWIQPVFDDATWSAGTLGAGYERGDGYQDLIGLDLEQQMFNQHSSVYIRVPFTVENVGEILAMDLEIQYDDAFTLYLNGERVAGANTVITPAWDATATSGRADANALDFAIFPLNSRIGLLREGDNLLAVHGLNSSPADEDLLIRPRLTITRLTSLTLGANAYFVSPSPGTPNGTQERLPTSEVVISEPSKTFTGSFRVTLRSAFPEETIRYTLDGTVPGSTSPIYTGQIPISRSTQLRARVFGANNAAGPVSMESYLRLTSNLENFSSNLPIVILENWGVGPLPQNSNNHTNGFWAIIEPDPVTGRASMTDSFQIATRCGLKRRGSSSQGWPKYSMTVEARDEEGFDTGIRPLGLPRESDWILSGRYQFDRALMRNPLVFRLSNETGEYAVRTRFVEVLHNTGGGSLDYNDDYFGVYTFMEKIKRDDSRVNVAAIDRRDSREPDVTGGYIFKKDRLDPGDSGFSVSGMGTLGWVEPKEVDVTRSQEEWLKNHLNQLTTALTQPNYTHPTTRKHFTEYLDQFSWLRHHWLNTLAMNVDGFRLSGFYYKHRVDTNGGKVGAGPIWDFDRSMGSTDGRDDNASQWDGTGDSSRTWNDSRYQWWEWALANPDFRQAHTDLWQELRETTFSVGNIYAVIDEFAAELDPDPDPVGINPGLERTPAARNFRKWNPGTVHSNEVINLKRWLRTRVGWIDRQYTSRPRFSTGSGLVIPGLVSPGGEFAFTASGVYYTTDGSDPRLRGGAISSSALRASGSSGIPVHQTTVVTARAYDTTPVHPLTKWSGPVTGTFLVGPIADVTNFIITEVHYAPLPPVTPDEIALTADASDFEFMEMQNIGATDTIDLTGVHFEAGIDFTFTGSDLTSLAPGARVLVVRNNAAFEARYGTGHSNRIAGEYAPTRLDNAGERIHLVDGLGNTLADFTYNDKHPWPSQAGFAGYSLVLNGFAIPGPDYTLAGNWRSSGLIGGNPNSSDRTPLAGDPFEDNDGDGLEAVLEHALGTSDADPTDTAGSYFVAIRALVVGNVLDDYLTLTFRRDLSADDVELIPEISFDFIDWWNGDSVLVLASEENQGDGTAFVTYRTAAPLDPAAHPQAFVRLRATMP